MKVQKVQKKEAEKLLGYQTQLQLPAFKRPAFADSLKFPDDLTELTSQNVSELLGKYTDLQAYVNSQRTSYIVECLRLQTLMERLETEAFIEQPQIAHLQRWRRDQKINSDSRMRDLKAKYYWYSQLREVAQLYFDNYQAYIQALSRELSRKLATNDGQRFSKFSKDKD